MRIVPYIPLSTTRTTIGRSYWTAVASSWPDIRKSPSPDQQTTVALRPHGLGGHRRRHAVAHRAARRRELARERVKSPEAMDPDGVVACAVRDDRVRRALAQVRDAHRPGRRRRASARALPRLVVGARRRAPVAPARLDAQVAHRRGELRHPREDRQLGLVDAAELLRARDARARASVSASARRGACSRRSSSPRAAGRRRAARRPRGRAPRAQG